MLVMFRVRNFASFKEETVLDLRAVSYKDMKNHVLKAGNNNIVKTLAIYGKNASGKSNLISALYYFESFIFNQFYDGGNKRDDEEIMGRMPDIQRNTFRLSDEPDNSSEFEIIFVSHGKTYQYGFSMSELENDTIIDEEWLLADEKTVFERENQQIIPGKKYEKELESIRKVRQDRLYLGTLDYFVDGEVKNIIDDIKEYFRKSFNVHFELILESSIKGVVTGVSYSERLFTDQNYKEIVERFVRLADVGITKIIIRENKEISGPGSPKYVIKTVHNVYDKNGKVVREEEFDLKMESSGTIRYFSFIQYILRILDEGGVFIVDEISARLHPVLTKFIVDPFQSKRNTRAQLIFTTHDLSLMNRHQMRRDEIAFVEKNEMGVSSLYTLADIKARSDASFSKDYLNGKYGAIPVINEHELDCKAVEEWLWAD